MSGPKVHRFLNIIICVINIIIFLIIQSIHIKNIIICVINIIIFIIINSINIKNSIIYVVNIIVFIIFFLGSASGSKDIRSFVRMNPFIISKTSNIKFINKNLESKISK